MLLAKQILLEREESQLQLSYKAQVSPSDVSRYMSGERKPYPNHAQRIADALGWTGEPKELFEEVVKND